MNTYEDSRIIVLNSADATKLNGTNNSNVNFQMNGLLRQDLNIIQSHIQLIASQIPHSFYIINIYNNKLYYTIGTIFSVTVPEGNYNAFNLITTMQSLFLANGHTITPVISRITGKITYTGTTNFTFNTLNSIILKILGFLPNVNTSSVSNVLASPFPLNLLGIKRITITSRNLATIAVNTLNLKTQTQSILATTYINEPVYGLVTHSNTTNANHLLKVSIIDNIDLQFADEDGNFINFNNQEWTMKLLNSSTYELIIGSKTTLTQITQQQIKETPNQEMTQNALQGNVSIQIINLQNQIPPLYGNVISGQTQTNAIYGNVITLQTKTTAISYIPTTTTISSNISIIGNTLLNGNLVVTKQIDANNLAISGGFTAVGVSVSIGEDLAVGNNIVNSGSIFTGKDMRSKKLFINNTEIRADTQAQINFLYAYLSLPLP